jgi:hypothetical protein
MPRTTKKSKSVPTEKFESLEAADGMKAPKNSGPRTVYDILAGGRRKETGQSVDEYTLYLESLSLAELQQHAWEKQLMPISNAKILRERLIQEFHRERIKGTINHQSIDPFTDPKKKAQCLEIMKNGR